MLQDQWWKEAVHTTQYLLVGILVSLVCITVLLLLILVK